MVREVTRNNFFTWSKPKIYICLVQGKQSCTYRWIWILLFLFFVGIPFWPLRYWKCSMKSCFGANLSRAWTMQTCPTYLHCWSNCGVHCCGCGMSVWCDQSRSPSTTYMSTCRSHASIYSSAFAELPQSSRWRWFCVLGSLMDIVNSLVRCTSDCRCCFLLCSVLYFSPSCCRWSYVSSPRT